MKILAIWLILAFTLSACGLFGTGTDPARTPQAKVITPIPTDAINPGEESTSEETLVFWQRSGGIAGICQQMTITLDYSYQIVNCTNNEVVASGQLGDPEKEQISSLTNTYTSIEWETPQIELGPDAFKDELFLLGTGTLQANGKELNEELAALAQTLIRSQ